jgi:dephospho-CoA kinase
LIFAEKSIKLLKRMIIGVCGYQAAGKDTVALYLKDRYGFFHYSLSEVLREILRKEGKKINRDTLTFYGNSLREKHGADFLAREVLRTLQRPAVITSIRNLAELKCLEKEADFLAVFVEAPAKLRYARAMARNREGEAQLSLEEFIKKEKREESENSTGQQLHLLKNRCRVILDNSGSKEELFSQIDQLLSKLGSKDGPKL